MNQPVSQLRLLSIEVILFQGICGAICTVLDDLGFDYEFTKMFDREFPPQVDFPLEQKDSVLAYWIRYISKAPKWEGLSDTKKKDIILQLKDDFNNAAEIAKRNKMAYDFHNWAPTTLLESVGYEINRDSIETLMAFVDLEKTVR